MSSQVVVRQVLVDNGNSLSTSHTELSASIVRLNEILNEPFVTVNTITGDTGIQLFFIFSLIPLLIYILAFPMLFLRGNWRKRFITGICPMYYYIQSYLFMQVCIL